MVNSSSRLMSLDLVVLLLLVPAHTQLQGIDFLLGLSLLFYIALVLWQPLTGIAQLPERFGRTRFAFLSRLALIYLMILAACVLPATRRIVDLFSRVVSQVELHLLEGLGHMGPITHPDVVNPLIVDHIVRSSPVAAAKVA